jgi:type II secretory pathway pseudopilin PulG
MKKHRSTTGGYTLIELIVYISLFVALSLLLVQSLITAMRVYAASEGTRAIAANADLALDRITREVRGAAAIAGGSVFGANPGTVELSGKDANGAARTVRFFVQDGVFEISENGATSALTTTDVRVTNFTAYQLTGAATAGVRVILTLESAGGSAQSATFYTSTLTRGK